MGDVVVVGAINVDLVVTADRLPLAGETVVGDHFAQHGGGKGANAAVAAARQGATVRLIGAVGTDDLGRWSLDQLAEEDVDVTQVARVDAATGVALIVVDANGENQIALGPGANGAVPVNPAAVDGAACVLVSTEINASAIDGAVRAALAQGLVCVLNPAPVVDAAIALVGAGGILTPNETELAQLCDAVGIPGGDLADRALALADRNGAPVVVTLGARGVGIARGGSAEMEIVPAIKVTVVDTTGAGDTLNGVLAAGLADGLELGDAVRRAAVAASLSVTVAGARTGMPNAAAVAAAFDPERKKK
ncbi:MAG TPA: ribokinase [Ilumatobacteraceae bacterium]|nr:ribokinase [Ilumatobacteraceae bacterium]